MNLSGLRGHSPIARLVKWDFLTIAQQQLTIFQLSKRVARSLCYNWASCCKGVYSDIGKHFRFLRLFHVCEKCMILSIACAQWHKGRRRWTTCGHCTVQWLAVLEWPSPVSLWACPLSPLSTSVIMKASLTNIGQNFNFVSVMYHSQSCVRWSAKTRLSLWLPTVVISDRL